MDRFAISSEEEEDLLHSAVIKSRPLHVKSPALPLNSETGRDFEHVDDRLGKARRGYFLQVHHIC